jgi:pimeloyl-[acyl-carrier protein] synthase
MPTESNTPQSTGTLFGPEMLADPYPIYHHLRAARPVAWIPQLDAWVATSYEAVSAALRNPNLSSERLRRVRQRLAARGLDVLLDERAKSMNFMDPPDHTRLRGLVSKAFTPRVVNEMEGHIRSLINRLLDNVAGRGRMDAIQDLAYPLPVTVIAEMLGIPTEDLDRFKRWSDEISAGLAGDVAALPDAVLRRVLEARNELAEYFRAAVVQRRQSPGRDLLTALVQAEDDGGRLTEDELLSTAVLLLVAGNETTTNLIGNGLLALLRHPEQMKRLWDDPSLVPSAVEEMLRYEGPVQLATRLAKVDLELHGVAIRQGQAVYLVLAAANRDPAQFTDPDRFDVGRIENKHVAFGAGLHFCLGAPLARLEAQLTLHALRERFPNGLRLGAENPEFRNNFNLRGLKALTIVF